MESLFIRGFLLCFIHCTSLVSPWLSIILDIQYGQNFKSFFGRRQVVCSVLGSFIVKAIKGTRLSQGLNSCRTSKGIADKPQCPSNSFRLQILMAFTLGLGGPPLIYSRPPSFIGKNPFYKYLMLNKHFKFVSGKARTEKKVALSASLSFPLLKYAYTDPAHKSF